MDEQITLEEMPLNSNDLTDDAPIGAEEGTEYFGCCDLNRECSNVGHCVHPDAERAKGCRYKANLETGNIFYGKNSQSFKEHKEDYDYLVAYNNSLPPEEKQVLSEIIVYMCSKNRGVSNHLCFYNEMIYKVLSSCKLFILSTPQQLILHLYEKGILTLESMRFIHGRFSTLPELEDKIYPIPETFKESNASAKQKYLLDCKIKDWVNYLIKTDIPTHEHFAKRFICFEAPLQMTIIEEFFNDYYVQAVDKCKEFHYLTPYIINSFDDTSLNLFKNRLVRGLNCFSKRYSKVIIAANNNINAINAETKEKEEAGESVNYKEIIGKKEEVQKTIFEAVINDFNLIGWNNWSQHLIEKTPLSLIKNTYSDHDFKIIEIDTDNKCGCVVQDNVIYNVSVKGCTCSFFSSKYTPCRHMIYLASVFASMADDNSLTVDDLLCTSFDRSSALTKPPQKRKITKRKEEKSNQPIFVVTGTLSSYTREEVKKLIEDAGGIVKSKVSSKTNFLVFGENPGSKLGIAKELGIQLITEDDLLEFLKNLPEKWK